MSNQTLNENLFAAVRDNRIELVRHALHAGVSLAFTDWAGYTVLHHLAIIGDTNIEIARLLIGYGANVNASAKLKKCPLHLACQLGNTKIARLLVENGADVNSKDILHMTPFHWAIQSNIQTLVEFLCEQTQINFDCIDKFGRSCFDIAGNERSMLSLLKVTCQKRRETQLCLNSQQMDKIFHIVNDLKSCASSSATEKDSKLTPSIKLAQRSVPIARKNYVFEELDSDESDDGLRTGLRSKKTRISSSPIQDIEGTLLWLQNQAMANSSDDFILEDREFYLTEAGVLTLEYLNKIDPIGDEQRLLLKIAKGLEPQSQTNQNQKDEIKKSNKDFEMSEEWPFSDPFNFDT